MSEWGYIGFGVAQVDVPRWMHLVAVWVCVSASGLAVVLTRVIDWALDRIVQSFEQDERHEAKQQ